MQHWNFLFFFQINSKY